MTWLLKCALCKAGEKQPDVGSGGGWGLQGLVQVVCKIVLFRAVDVFSYIQKGVRVGVY